MDKTCPSNPIRKDLIEQIVIDATYEALSSSENITLLSEKIIEAHKKRIDNESILKLLLADFGETEKR